jgi:hypothetical protein
MKTKMFLLAGICLSATQLNATEGAVTPLDATKKAAQSAPSSSEAEKPLNGVSTTVEEKTPRPRTRIQGNFKGKDPMIAPDGEIKTKPTDGSRPSGNK